MLPKTDIDITNHPKPIIKKTKKNIGFGLVNTKALIKRHSKPRTKSIMKKNVVR
jgi:hypothetical protein